MFDAKHLVAASKEHLASPNAGIRNAATKMLGAMHRYRFNFGLQRFGFSHRPLLLSTITSRGNTLQETFPMK